MNHKEYRELKIANNRISKSTANNQKRIRIK